MLIMRAICGDVQPLRELTGGVTRKLGEGALTEVFLSATRRRRSIEKSVLRIVPVGHVGQTSYTDIACELRATR